MERCFYVRYRIITPVQCTVQSGGTGLDLSRWSKFIGKCVYRYGNVFPIRLRASFLTSRHYGYLRRKGSTLFGRWCILCTPSTVVVYCVILASFLVLPILVPLEGLRHSCICITILPVVAIDNISFQFFSCDNANFNYSILLHSTAVLLLLCIEMSVCFGFSI